MELEEIIDELKDAKKLLSAFAPNVSSRFYELLEMLITKAEVNIEPQIKSANGGYKLKPLLKKLLDKKQYISEPNIPDYLRNVVTTNDIKDIFLDYNIEED